MSTRILPLETNSISLTLTIKQWKKIEDVLSDHWDRGPYGEGWQSKELQEVHDALEQELEKAVDKLTKDQEFLWKQLKHQHTD